MAVDTPLILGWVFTIIGLSVLIMLITYIEAGRSKQINIPFTASCIVILSVFLGLGIQFLLVAEGL